LSLPLPNEPTQHLNTKSEILRHNAPTAAYFLKQSNLKLPGQHDHSTNFKELSEVRTYIFLRNKNVGFPFSITAFDW